MALNSKRILRITIAMACLEALFLKAPPPIRSPKTPYEDIYISLRYTCPTDKQKTLRRKYTLRTRHTLDFAFSITFCMLLSNNLQE